MNKAILFLTTVFLAFTTVHAAPSDKSGRPDFSQICKGKTENTKISVKNNDRVMTGSCQLRFIANNPEKLERGAQRHSTIQNACKGKAKGASVSVKYNGQSIPGKCNVTFKPDMKK